MRVRTRGSSGVHRGGAHWRRALGLSFGLHVLALAAIGRLAVGVRSDGFGLGVSWMTSGLRAPEGATLVDLAISGMEVEVLAPSPPPVTEIATTAPAQPLNPREPAPWGDQEISIPAPPPHPLDGALPRHAPAADRGTGTGRPVPDPAWRRDTTTLHDRLSDGANRNQPSHARTARTVSSAQAVRREAQVGAGDSVRTERPILALPSPAGQYGIVDPTLPGAGAETMPGTGIEIAPTDANAAPVEQSRPDQIAPSQGPLEADRGARSFDVDPRGFLAADDHAMRAASSEAHPSIMDLTLAAVSGTSAEGRGPSDMPGASRRASKGTSPAPPGFRSTSDGAGEQARARERLYRRYNQEIEARVNQALVFPRTLAIRLEQGETVVRFAVLADGKVGDSVHVVKSSGFAEFDQAALNAVRKASPFPPILDPHIPRPLQVSLPVTFSNPVIR